MKLLNSAPSFNFTRLYAHIVEEDGAFTVRVRMLNHLRNDESCWGEEIAATFDAASLMVGSVARQFSIPQECISIKIVMRHFKDGTIH
jgi:hypothetical protein